ncbi:MAG: serine/threonine-protein kinase [Gammaproteobacteria bacterium]
MSKTEVDARLSRYPTIPDIEIQGVIGDGAMGVVYAGRQIYLDRPIAVKILKRFGALSDPSFVQRFQREAKTLAALRHPSIVSCYHAGVTEQGDYYLAMELIDGCDLHRWVSQKGPLSEIQALEVVRKVARALEYALGHGIIHRDVKTANILLQRTAADDEAPFEPKLADLGLARTVGNRDTRLTLPTQIAGTPSNMAPEQFGDPEQVDFRADLYALGCVLFEILTGHAPFPERDFGRLMVSKLTPTVLDASTRRPGLSAEVNTLVRTLLAPDREDRPQSYSELLATINRLTAGPLARPAQGRASRKRHLLTAVLAGCFVLGVFAPAFIASWREGTLRDTGVRPAPAAAAPKALSAEPLVEVKFKEAGEALVSSDVADPFPAWEASTGDASWIAEEEGGGVNGIGSGRKVHKLGPVPWRVDGSLALLTKDSKEAGIRIELEGGGALVLALKKLDRLYGSLVEVSDEARPEKRSRILHFAPVDSGLLAHVPFTLLVYPRGVRVLLGGRSWGEFPVQGSAQGIALFVKGATASFRDLVLHRPVS